jgi:hypothetical protein
MRNISDETMMHVGDLSDLIDRRDYRGLPLRPPRRLLQLLHLAREHAAAVAYRPISFGNRGYLEERVTDLHHIGQAIQDMLPGLKPAWQSMAGHLCRLLSTISSDRKKKAFDRIVTDCDKTRYKEYWFHEVTCVPAADVPLLTHPYDRFLVVIGPGIGLGDELSCAELLLSLKRKFFRAAFEFYGYYANVWPHVHSTFKSYGLAGCPMTAFECVDQAMKTKQGDHLLVVYINFTGLCFHLAFSLDRIRPDIVEIAVGQGKMWFMPRDGMPVQVAHGMDPLYPQNYGVLRRLAGHLVRPIPCPSSKPGKICQEDAFQIVISPLTSKPILLTPADWANMIEKTLDGVTNRKPVSCVVLPGMSAMSADYAREIAERTSTKAIADLHIGVLNKGLPLTPDTAFSKVYQAMSQSHLAMGIDTYTSHLAAMMSVASINLCYERNSAFWPDVSNSWWIELRQGLETITDLSSLLFGLVGGTKAIDRFEPGKAIHSDIFLKLDSLFSSIRDIPTHETLQNILKAGHEAWNLIPHRYRHLIAAIDGNYAWPRVINWLSDDRLDEKMRFWILDILGKSHFRKFCVLAGLPKNHFQPSSCHE